MNEIKAFEREFGVETQPSPSVDGGANLWSLLNDRMHGRWKWAIAAGLVLGVSLAVVGFRLAVVSYSARGLVQVDAELPTLVMQTPETRTLSNFAGFMGSQAELMRDSRVVADALKSDQLQAHLAALGDEPQAALQRGLSVQVLGGTNLISVQYSAEDRRLAQAAVNSIIEAYFRIYGPNAETTHTRTIQQVRTLLADSRRRLADLESERERVVRESAYGTLDASGFIEDLVRNAAEIQAQLDQIRELRGAIEAIATSEGRSVGPRDVAPPTDDDLLAADPSLAAMLEAVAEDQQNLSQLRTRMSDQHPQVRQAISRLESTRAALESKKGELAERWSETMVEELGYESLGLRAAELSEELSELRSQIQRDQRDRSRLAAIDRDVSIINNDLVRYEDRLSGLETESETIRQGRVTIRAMAQLPAAPSRDRRIQYGAAGFMGGFAASLAAFFLLGTVDRRAFVSRQLETDFSRFRPLGVVPDMSRLGETDEERVLLEDCVHRIRNRIEVRRSHGERGFALKVSSPFQGDGKTSVAAALAWSYAQAGYRTVMVDADFIGRALSHQFSMLGFEGVREAMRDPGRALDLIRSARPNLDILPAGSDRAVTAGHMQPAAMRELLSTLRDRYEIVIVDTGPMTASVESLPIIGAVDGVALVLRRGRNRDRLKECIDDIRHVGTPFLGAILNYASLSDCQRYSSLSRVSTEQGDHADATSDPLHPVVSALGHRASVGGEFEVPDR